MYHIEWAAMDNKAAISLTIGLEDAERLTVALLVALIPNTLRSFSNGALQAGEPRSILGTRLRAGLR